MIGSKKKNVWNKGFYRVWQGYNGWLYETRIYNGLDPEMKIGSAFSQEEACLKAQGLINKHAGEMEAEKRHRNAEFILYEGTR